MQLRYKLACPFTQLLLMPKIAYWHNVIFWNLEFFLEILFILTAVKLTETFLLKYSVYQNLGIVGAEQGFCTVVNRTPVNSG